MNSPLVSPSVRSAIVDSALNYAMSFNGDFDRYYTLMMDQDTWDDVVRNAVSPEVYSQFEKFWEYKGEYPDRSIIRLLSDVEEEVFGETVESMC